MLEERPGLKIVAERGSLVELRMLGFRCERCDHAWIPPNPAKPKVCPKCKTPYWDRPRRDGQKSPRLRGHTDA